MGFGLPPVTPMVKRLLIINLAVFVLDMLLYRGGTDLGRWFAAEGQSLAVAVQVWRLVTFQFMHANTFHLLFNMIGLFFLGPMLERTWGSQRFLVFYLTCGAVGGALFVLASLAGVMGGALVGASGGVLGMLAACAVLFPHVTVILMFFPMPIRTAAVLLTAVYFLNVLSGGINDGGDLCHLGGMATGAAWVLAGPRMRQWRTQLDTQQRLRRQQDERYTAVEVDRILAKVHEQGIQSLTRREKEILREATERQKQQGPF